MGVDVFEHLHTRICRPIGLMDGDREQVVAYLILPITDLVSAARPDCPECVEEILRVRHHSLFAPRDFDVSPYFEVIKPAISADFDFHALHWSDVAERVEV